jgi:enterobacterial common antigen flippase
MTSRTRHWLQLRRLKDLGASLLGTFAIQSMGLISAVMAARLLKPTDRGEVAAAVAWALMLAAVADLGVSQAIPFYVARRQRGVGSAAVTIATIAACVISPIALVVVATTAYPLSTAAVAYAVVGGSLSLVTSYLAALYQGEARHGLFAVYRLAGVFPYLLGLLAAGLVHDRNAGHVLWFSLVMSCAICGSGIWLARRTTRQFGSLQRVTMRRLLKYGIRTYIGNLAWNGNQRVPTLLLGGTAGTLALGYYSVAQSYAVIPFSIAGGFALLAAGRVASHRGADAVRRCKRLCAAGICATWLVVVALIPAGAVVIPAVYGSPYVPAVAPATVLLISSGVIGTNFILSASLRALGFPAASSYAEALGLLATLAATPVLIERFGIVGAAMASVASGVLVVPVLILFLRRSFRTARTYGHKGNVNEDLCADTSVQCRSTHRTVDSQRPNSAVPGL